MAHKNSNVDTSQYFYLTWVKMNRCDMYIWANEVCVFSVCIFLFSYKSSLHIYIYLKLFICCYNLSLPLSFHNLWTDQHEECGWYSHKSYGQISQPDSVDFPEKIKINLLQILFPSFKYKAYGYTPSFKIYNIYSDNCLFS